MAASSTKSTSKKQKAKRGKGSMLLILLAVAIPLLIVGFIVWWLFGGGSTLFTQREMQDYLKEKYSKEFIVKDIRTEGAGIGQEGDLVGTGISTDEKTVQFRVWGDPPKSYRDTYLSSLWSSEENTEFANYISALLVKPNDFTVDIRIPPQTMDTISPSASLQEVLRDYSDKTSYGVRVIVSGDEPTEANFRDVIKLINYVKPKNNTNYNVRYVINSPTLDSRYFCQYYNTLEGTDTIPSTKDISDCFRYSKGRE